MRVRELRREAAIDRMADLLLAEGMAAASLRPLAAAAGTSDRMLLYYFADRDELLAATLGRVADRLRIVLDVALPEGERLSYAALLNAVWTAVGTPAVAPFMQLWLEVAAGAARGRATETAIAGAIVDEFATWVGRRIADEAGTPRAASAARLLATVEGLSLLDLVGRRDLALLALKFSGA